MQVTAAELRNRFNAFGTQPALIDSSGTRLDHAALLHAADEWATRLGPARRLVLLEASNTVAAIAAYLGCLFGRHPVALVGGGDQRYLADLAARYRPDAILRPDTADPIVWRDRDPTRMLHADLALLLSSSGSTGSPKLIKLSLANIVSNADAIAAYLAIDGSSRAMVTLPLQYSYGMSVVNAHLFAGGSLLLNDTSISDPAFFRALAEGKATSFAGVPYTFEMLKVAEHDWAAIPRLAHVTQAGGRLSPDLVRHFAALGEQHGWRFHVMYGQTECAPRIAHLPPEQAQAHPECIGVPIPGGEIALVAADGRVIEGAGEAGELLYRGPNVMLGYADAVADLATGSPPNWHHTGDLALRTNEGLYRITGRIRRIVKPFGLRINLDEVEAGLRAEWPSLVCAGSDERIVVAIPAGQEPRDEALRARLLGMLNLPPAAFVIVRPDAIPLLASGKPDYREILRQAAKSAPRLAGGSALRTILSWRFLRQVGIEAAQILGLIKARWTGVGQIYATILGIGEVPADASFVTLAGDSLSYVQISLALEQYLGHLPLGWESRTVADLEREGPLEQTL